MIYRNHIKRIIDFILSLIALIVLSPVLVTVAALVKIKLGSPIIFKQQRPGLNEKLFTIYKFRTMSDEKGIEGDLLSDSIRLTKFGRFLRSTSLDELPELWNIFKGDLSIVGPRPLAIQYLPYYSENERIRHTVRPGLTGLAQVNGRNVLIWEDKFAFDLQYVENISVKMDVLIIIKTIIKVFKKADIGERGIDAPLDFDVYRQNKKII